MYEAAYTAESWAAQMKNPQNRVEAVGRAACEAVGGKLIGGWYCFGDYDLVIRKHGRHCARDWGGPELRLECQPASNETPEYWLDDRLWRILLQKSFWVSNEAADAFYAWCKPAVPQRQRLDGFAICRTAELVRLQRGSSDLGPRRSMIANFRKHKKSPDHVGAFW
jgi:hypothetical protein